MSKPRARRDRSAKPARRRKSTRPAVPPDAPHLALLAGVCDLIDDSVLISHASGRILYANRAAERTLGRARGALIGQDVAFLRPPDALAPVPAGGPSRTGAWPGETVSYHRDDGQEVLLSVVKHAIEEDSAGGACVVTFLRDVTAEWRMQEQLVQSEKMLALGQLVSGVTHDLSNPLTSIVGFAQLMLSRSDDPKTRRGLEVIASEAARAARIVQNLLAFARARQPEKSSQDLNALIENTLELKGYDLRVAQIEVDADLDPDLPRIPMDASQIQQVVLNLLVNAAQALRQRESERTIRIATRRRDGGVQLAVEDNGPGLNPADLAKVFDPFFTTRPARTGAGLGLSTCHGMVSEHGGTIRAENRPAGGARFVVELPHTDAEAAAAHEAAPDRNTRARSAAVAGSARPRTILVVDDQPAIQDVLVAMLSQEGHSVDTAGSGDSALRKLRNRSYDMVLSDLRMPGLGGIELYRRLLGDDPWMAERVVFMTGDLFSEESDHFIRTTANLRLAKPFTLDSLRETLRRFDDRFRHD